MFRVWLKPELEAVKFQKQRNQISKKKPFLLNFISYYLLYYYGSFAVIEY